MNMQECQWPGRLSRYPQCPPPTPFEKRLGRGVPALVRKLCPPSAAHAAEKLAAAVLLHFLFVCLEGGRAQGEGQGEGRALLVGIIIVRGGESRED